MAALLSPLQLQAGAALLQDQGITANVALIDKLDTYNANPLIAPRSEEHTSELQSH